jgi:5'-nucleotidase
MPDVSHKLVVAVSARALFNLEEENRLFKTSGVDAYRRYQREHENDPLERGPGFPFVQRLLSLNHIIPGYEPVDVILLSRNDPDIGLRILTLIEREGLAIVRSVFTTGGDRMKYLKPFNVSLFLSGDYNDVKNAVEHGYPAGHILGGSNLLEDATPQLRLAFDFDGVLASDESERIYAQGGLQEYEKYEEELVDEAISPGPLQSFILGICEIQNTEREHFKSDADHIPIIRTAVVTARGAPAHKRAIKTLRAWGVRVDEALFLGGMPKHDFLAQFKPHMFFDDQLHNLDPARAGTATVHIPYGVRNIANID